MILSSNAAARVSSRPSIRNYRVGVPLVVIALLYPRSIVLKRFRLRGPEDTEALSRGFREYDHYASGRFFNADRVEARSAFNLVVQDLTDRDVFAVYRNNIARDAL